MIEEPRLLARTGSQILKIQPEYSRIFFWMFSLMKNHLNPFPSSRLRSVPSLHRIKCGKPVDLLKQRRSPVHSAWSQQPRQCRSNLAPAKNYSIYHDNSNTNTNLPRWFLYHSVTLAVWGISPEMRWLLLVWPRHRFRGSHSKNQQGQFCTAVVLFQHRNRSSSCCIQAVA